MYQTLVSNEAQLPDTVSLSSAGGVCWCSSWMRLFKLDTESLLSDLSSLLDVEMLLGVGELPSILFFLFSLGEGTGGAATEIIGVVLVSR